MERTRQLNDEYNSRTRDKKTYDAELDYHLAKRNMELLEAVLQTADVYANYFETGLALIKEVQEQTKQCAERLKKAEKPSRAEFQKRAALADASNIAEILQASGNTPASPSPDTKIFGVSLKDVLKRSGEPGPIPAIIDKMCSYIEANGLLFFFRTKKFNKFFYN